MVRNQSEIVIFVDLPGAGKSSFYRATFADTHQLISKDRMKNRKHKEVYQQKRIRSGLEQKLSVVVDNMNLTQIERRHLIQIAQEWNVRIRSLHSN